MQAVAGWARAVQASGATPFYGTTFDNIASQRLAARLGLSLVGAGFSLTCERCPVGPVADLTRRDLSYGLYVRPFDVFDTAHALFFDANYGSKWLGFARDHTQSWSGSPIGDVAFVVWQIGFPAFDAIGVNALSRPKDPYRISTGTYRLFHHTYEPRHGKEIHAAPDTLNPSSSPAPVP